MKAVLTELLTDETGFILSTELILIVTIGVLGLVTGLACLQQAVVFELQDLSLAITSLNQSYATPTFTGCRKWWGSTSWFMGSRFFNYNNGLIGGGVFGNGYGYAGDVVGGSSYYTAPAAVIGGTTAVAPNTCAVEAPPTIPCQSCPEAQPGMAPTPTPLPSPSLETKQP